MKKIISLICELAKLKRDIEKSNNFEKKKYIMDEYDKVRNEILSLNEKIKKFK